MNILVTGGKGWIGTSLMLALSKKHTVQSFDLQDEHDIRKRRQVEKAIEGVDVVYHLAALTDVQQSLKTSHAYYETNTMGTLNVALACRKFKKKLIFASTAAVYDPYTSPYAQSKFFAEQIITLNHLSSVILRLFNVYGPGMNKTTMLSRFINEDPITIYGNGTQSRDFIDIRDVVSIFVDALRPQWTGCIVDVGTGQSRTVEHIARWLRKPILYKRKRSEIYQSQADTRMLRSLYRKPFYSLQSYIQSCTVQH